MRRKRNPECIAAWVGGDGTLQRSNDPGVSVRRSAAGTFIVALPSDFRLVGVTVSVIGSTASQVANVSALTSNSFNVNAFSPSPPTPSDVAFSFVAVGV